MLKISITYRPMQLHDLLITLLTVISQKHTPISNHAHSCREIWPNKKLEQAYTVLLDLALLVVPLLLMTLAYLNVIYILVHDVRPPSFNAHEQVSFAHGNSANKKSSGKVNISFHCCNCFSAKTVKHFIFCFLCCNK